MAAQTTVVKVDLINPPLTALEQEDALRGIANIIPPLGIGYIAACLLAVGCDVSICDCRLDFSWERLEAELKKRRPDIVGITITTPSYAKAVELARFIRACLPEVVLVAGGPHVTAIPEEALKETEFDIGVCGEGEEALVEIVEAFRQRRKDYATIKGIVYRLADGTLKLNPARASMSNLDSLPFPARHLYPPLSSYAPVPASYRYLPFAHMLTSRGCPYQCIFCDRKVFGNAFRARSAGNVLAEIEELISRYGVREIKFFDDTFTIDKQRVHEICAGMTRLKPRVAWTCLARVDTVSKELLVAMHRAGCWQIGLGLESGDATVLKNSKKGITLEQGRAAVRWAKEAGLNVRAFFILGFPDDTVTTMQRTIDFAKSLPIDVANFYNLTIYPGTELCSRLTQQGLLRHKDYQHYLQLSLPEGVEVSYLPPQVTAAELRRMLKRAHTEFYLRPGYILSQLLQIRSLEDIKRYLSGFRAITGL